MTNEKKQYVLKWYDALKFPENLREEFIGVLNSCPLTDEDFSKTTQEIREMDNSQFNLIYTLFRCEDTWKKYQELNIPIEIFLDTMSDITVWTMHYYEKEHKFGFDIILWMEHHFNLELFKLGNLQFCRAPSIVTNEEFNLKEGDNTLDMHIQRYVSLDIADIKESFDMAKEFFEKYFPDYDYKYFTCNSWLLNPILETFLGGNSKIVGFQKLFTVIYKSEGDNLLSFIFPRGTNRENIKDVEAKTTLQKKIKEYIMSGKPFHNCYGVIAKENTP